MGAKMLKNRNLLLLWIGGFISSIGDQLYNIVITIQLYNLTKDINSIVIMWLSRGVLRIPVQYLSGFIADRCNKKRVIVITNLLSVPAAFLFVFMDKNNIWLAYLLAFVLQSLNDIDVCSETAILPQIVEKEEISYANSVLSSLSSAAVFIGPALGFMIYKVSGSNILFIINSISFLIAGSLFCFIKYDYKKAESKSKSSSFMNDIKEGYAVIIKYADVKALFLLMSIYVFFRRFYEIFKVVIADNSSSMGAWGIGWFNYALAIGGLSLPIFVKLFSKFKELNTFIISSVFMSVLYIIFGYSHKFFITIPILVLLGVFQGLQGVYSCTIIQKSVPQECIGRVFAFYKIHLTLFSLIAMGISSPMYHVLGIGNSFLILSVISMIICGAFFAFKIRVDRRKIDINVE